MNNRFKLLIITIMLIFTSLVCNSQIKSHQIETRKFLSDWLQESVDEPCKNYHSINKLITKSSKNGSIIKDTIVFLLNKHTFILSKLYIGENDCIEHQLWLYSIENNIKIDSILIDYLGDSFGTIDIQSTIQIKQNKLKIKQKELEVIYDDENKKTTKRNKNYDFELIKSKHFKLVDNDSIIIKSDKRLMYIYEYIEDFKSMSVFEKAYPVFFQNENFNFVMLKNKMGSELFVLKKMNNKFYEYLKTNSFKFENPNFKILNIKNSNELLLISISQNSNQIDFYFKYDNGFYLSKINKNNNLFKDYSDNKRKSTLSKLSSILKELEVN
jgi:hypothetical protein